MPRTPRCDAPGNVHHVMMRGIERRDLFRDDRDREDFLERLCELLPEEEVRCLGWALMPNHVHLLVRTGTIPLSRVMSRLNTGYATRFNKRHERSGYLFQNRFKSRLAVDDADLMNLVRYVNGNPLKDHLVTSLRELASFPWSGYGALVGARSPHHFEAVDCVLEIFGRSTGEARKNLRSWMGGDGEDLEEVGAAVSSKPLPVRRLAGAAPGRDFETLLTDVSRRFGIESYEVFGGSQRSVISRARAVLCFFASRETGMSGAELSRALGVTETSISRCIQRGRQIAGDGMVPRGEKSGK